MGQILGLGITHFPNLAAKANMSRCTQQCLEDPTLPAHLRAVKNWHPTMREQCTNSDKVFAVYRP